MSLGVLGLLILVGLASHLVLRTILYEQLDGTLLHLAEVEAQAGAAAGGPEFQFHEGVLLTAREGSPVELTRYAQLWTSDGRPLVRSQNLAEDLDLPEGALLPANAGRVVTNTHTWHGTRIRSIVYPLVLVGTAHQIHLLQVAAPTAPIGRTLVRFGVFLILLTVVGTAGGYALGQKMASAALRPTEEITAQAEAITAGTLSERITAHADVEEFTRLVSVLNSMLDRLDEAFQVQRQFTADAGHELRAPLTALKGDIDVTLKRDRTATEYRETLLRCREEVERLVRLAEDLLALARSDAALPLEYVADVDLQVLVDRVVARSQSTAAARGIRIDCSTEKALIPGDERLLERVVTNLVGNALKHGRHGGEVRVVLERDTAVRLIVRDDGPGVPPEHVPHLFVRFWRGDPARHGSEGTGLGLAIAKAGTEAHGGTLEFLGNSPGAVFCLTLPLDRTGTPDRSTIGRTMV
jgi:two-component system OmpR family sensor kinase